jgi:excisionase family DNA binding protein
MQHGDAMNGLLTTRQVQNILQIDRTTVYRMLKDGRLTGIKIGNQWRFPQAQIDALLAYSPAAAEPPTAAEVTESLSSDILPLTCLQGMQNVSAEAIGVSAIITSPAGKPLTQMSNACRFCQIVRSSETGREACRQDLVLSAQRANSPTPQIVCHAGLRCLSAPININGTETAVFIAGQYQKTPFRPDHIPHLAKAYNLDEAALRDAAGSIPLFDAAQQQKITDWLPKLTRTLSAIGQERADLLGRLERIAAMSTVTYGKTNQP